MIYTVTLNPAIDYLIICDALKIGKINRTKRESLVVGGKGINISKVLKNFQVESVNFGFLGGFTGDFIEKSLYDEKINCDFVHTEDGFSRINVKIKSEEETDINGQGPKISEENINEFFEKLEKMEDGDIVVLSGNIPKNLSEDFYEKIIKKVNKKDIKIVVDAEKKLVLNTLKYSPFLIKPNNFELEEILGEKLESLEKIIDGAKKLQKMGAKNVLVSRGGDGGVFVAETGEIFCCDSPKGTVVNTTGAGDSVVAGFLAEFEKSKDFERAFKFGISTGSATAFSEEFPTLAEVEKLFSSTF